MALLVINGVTFDGLPKGTGNQSGWQPTAYSPKESKIGVTLAAANGTRNRVERSVTKRIWEITWEKTNLATMQTVRTISRLTAPFSFTDLESGVYTVQTEDEFAPEWTYNDAAGNTRWNVKLVLYQQ